MAVINWYPQATMDGIRKFVEVAFRTEDSLFTPGRKIWKPGNRAEIYERFVLNPDTSGDPFTEKFRGQIGEAGDESIQFAAELLYSQMLGTKSIKQAKKVQLVEQILGWMEEPVSIPEERRKSLKEGLVVAQSFAQWRFAHLRYLLNVLKAWDEVDSDQRQKLLSDPWAFKEWVSDVSAKEAYSMAEMLLFYVHPDTFESITSRPDKKKIVKAFEDRLAESSDDRDKDLFAIRRLLSNEYGEGFSFYEKDLRPLWDEGDGADQERWDLFMGWASRVREAQDFQKWEVDYKREIAKRISQARAALLEGRDNWFEALKKAFGPPNSLTAWQTHDRFLKWCQANPQKAQKALESLWGDGSPNENMARFLELFPKDVAKGKGTRAALLAFLMMGVDEERYAMYRDRPFNQAYKLTGRDSSRGRDARSLYDVALTFLDDMMDHSSAWDNPINNRLEAQGSLWGITKWDTKPSNWSEDEWMRLNKYREGEKWAPSPPKPPRDFPLNVILYGPPGTGKTYQAVERAVEICDGTVDEDRHAIVDRYKKLAEDGRIDFVTFHQSYGYEEFVEGYRPVSNSQGEEDESGPGGMQYEVQDGAFKGIASSARVLGGRRSRTRAQFDPSSGKTVWKMSLGRANDEQDAYIFDTCMRDNMLLLGYGQGLDYAGCSTRDEVLAKLHEATPEAKRGDYEVKAVHSFKNEMDEGDFVVVTDGNRKFRAIGRVAGPYQFHRSAEYGQMRPVEWLLTPEESISHEKISRKNFSQRTLYPISQKQLKAEAFNELLARAATGEPSNHVLIIDEINRGNISKILGELITLLEPDKRLGRPNELKSKLPYSGDDFGVPPNLYVIGTMNTADRSIAFLDTALRRRFDFEEIMPDADVIRKTGDNGVIGSIDVAGLLDTINGRIERLFDRDHMIGHSYLLGCQSLRDLQTAFRRQVIPLLQEYFYGDWERVCLVLGCPWDSQRSKPACVNQHPLIVGKAMAVLPNGGSDADEFEDRLSYSVNPDFLKADEQSLPPFFSGIQTAGMER